MNIRILTWQDIDKELDEVEEGDVLGVVSVFLAHQGEAVLTDGGQRRRVNLSNFSRHVGMSRYTLESWAKTLDRASA